MTEQELAALEAIWAPHTMWRKEDVTPYWAAERAVEVLALVELVRLQNAALRIAAEEFRGQGGGTVETHMAELLHDARKALKPPA